MNQPNALLYSNLDLKEAGEITRALDQANIRYEAKGDGSTIMVARDQVASTRLLLSGEGLPTAGSVGYEIFDQSSVVGQTDFVQQLNRQRALEGELARTIQSLDGVNSARVHLVMPKKELFDDEIQHPSASVSISVGAREPSPDQVRAIQNLIAGAVPNMKPDRVTVVDQHAKTLSGGAEGDAMAADGRKSAVEARIAKTVKTMVEGVVGQGKARVNVTAELDLSQVTIQQETFDPDGQVVRSETTSEENANENQPNQTGQVTAAANIPGAPPNPDGLISSNSGRTGTTTNYDISKTIRTEIKEPGQVKRLSVAVAVDGITAPAGEDGKPGAYSPRPAAEMQRIEQLVRTAVGFDPQRGDQVTVINVQFPNAGGLGGGVVTANPLMGFDKNDIMQLVQWVILLIVALLAIFFVVRPLFGSGSGLKTGVTRLMPGADQAIMLPSDPSTGEPLALPGPDPSEMEQRIEIARIEGQVKTSSIKRVAEFVQSHPEESVAMLRTWLHQSA
jgi:flagellar M-ring protein FliF